MHQEIKTNTNSWFFCQIICVVSERKVHLWDQGLSTLVAVFRKGPKTVILIVGTVSDILKLESIHEEADTWIVLNTIYCVKKDAAKCVIVHANGSDVVTFCIIFMLHQGTPWRNLGMLKGNNWATYLFMKLPNLCNCLRLDHYHLCTVLFERTQPTTHNLSAKRTVCQHQHSWKLNLKVSNGENGQSEITKDLLNIIKDLMNATQDLLIATYAKYNIIP